MIKNLICYLTFSLVNDFVTGKKTCYADYQFGSSDYRVGLLVDLSLWSKLKDGNNFEMYPNGDLN